MDDPLFDLKLRAKNPSFNNDGVEGKRTVASSYQFYQQACEFPYVLRRFTVYNATTIRGQK